MTASADSKRICTEVAGANISIMLQSFPLKKVQMLGFSVSWPRWQRLHRTCELTGLPVQRTYGCTLQYIVKVKVKYPRYRSTWPRGVQQVKAPQISRHSAHESGKVVTPTHRPPLPPGIFWYSFLEAESTPGTWTCRMLRKKSPVTRPGFDPWTSSAAP